MYARFTEATIDPKKREQAEMIAESIFTAARQQKGFNGVSFCVDPKGEAVFLSLWESKEAMQANEASGYYKEQVDKLKDVLTKPTTRHAGEVKAQEETHKTPKVARLTITGFAKTPRRRPPAWRRTWPAPPATSPGSSPGTVP